MIHLGRPTWSLRQLADADFARLAIHIPVEALRGQTVLLTGATGFFGVWLLSLFDWLHREAGWNGRVLAVSRDPAAFLARHPHFTGAVWLEWVAGDVRDFPLPRRTIDSILHAATDTSASAGLNAELMFNTIAAGTQRVLDCARFSGTSRVLLVSSGAVYGGQGHDVTRVTENTPIPEAGGVLTPANAYGDGKREMERIGSAFARQTAVGVNVARCFAFVGAGLPLDGHFAIGNFIRDALSKDRVVVKGGGTAQRSYLYAADLAIWLVRLLLTGHGRAYNVGSDQALTIAQLAQRVTDILAPGKLVVIEGRDDPANAHNRYVPSITLARNECALDVWTSIDRAIKRTADYRL